MRIRWTPIKDICALLETSSPDGACYAVEATDGATVAGACPDQPGRGRHELLAHGETHVATALTSAAVPPSLAALFVALCDREIAQPSK